MSAFSLLRTTALAAVIFGILRLPSVQSSSVGLQQKPKSKPIATCAIQYPVKNPFVTSRFGNRQDPLNPSSHRFHTGVDFGGAMGTPVFSPACGTVVFAGSDNSVKSYDFGYGLHIKVKDSKGRIHLLGHLSQFYVKQGDKIKAGQLVGQVGSTGNSTGPHLHYEIRVGGDDHSKAVDPRVALAKVGREGD